MSDIQETFAEIIAEMRSGRLSATVECESCGNEQEQRFTFNGLADRLEAAHRRECDEMLDALVRIGNWCAQDLAEDAYGSDSSGNYLKTLNGLCEVCRPFMQKASRLKRYGGVE